MSCKHRNEKDGAMELNNKEILFTGDTMIKDIQDEFSTCYPFLKIEFYPPGQANSYRRIMIEPRTVLNHLAQITPGGINISTHRTVAEVSGDFREILGVAAKVSRKSGNVWSTISISDGWTLQSQNVAGAYISSEMAMDTTRATG